MPQRLPARSASWSSPRNGVRHSDTVTDSIGGSLRDGDEAILLTRSDRVGDLPGPARPWLRVVGFPDTGIFALHSRIPGIVRREWVVLLEDHTFVTGATLAALQAMIWERRDID